MSHVMPQITQNAAGAYELPRPDGRVMVCEHLPTLERMAASILDEQEQNALFLEGWKAGVQIVGTRFFDVQAASIEAATDKEQLRPDCQAVEQDSGALSHGERVFLYALCAFFNREWAAELAARYGETGNVGELAVHLDSMRLQVITQLLTSYRGW